jgi:hypothetical protein
LFHEARLVRVVVQARQQCRCRITITGAFHDKLCFGVQF